MDFAGRLQVAGDADAGIAAVVHIIDGHITVTNGDEDLGGWPLSGVEVTHLGGDRFALTVDGDDTVFVADDPARFTDEGIAAIAAGRRPSESGALGWLWSLLSRPARPEPPDPVAPGLRTVSTAAPAATEPEQRDETDVTITVAPAATEPEQPDETDVTIEVAPPAKPEEIEQADETTGIAQDEIDSSEIVRCGAERRDGLSCRSLIVGPSGLCFAHDPARAAERLAARQRTRARAKKPSPEAVPLLVTTDLIHRLDEVIQQVQSGEISPTVASAIADVVQAMSAARAMKDRPSGIEQTPEQGRRPPSL